MMASIHMHGILNRLSKRLSELLITGLAVLSLHVPFASAGEASGAWTYAPEKLRPFWLSRTMEGESVLFIKNDSGDLPRSSLLFEPTRILSVRSSSGKIVYKEGIDYVWKKGTKELTLPTGSSIVFKTPQDLRRPASSQPFRLPHRDGNGEILFGGGHEYHDMQTVVTYRHKANAWTGTIPSFAGDRLPRTLLKLKKKQPLTIALLGDSISTGCNASGWSKTPPFQPPYQELLVQHLQAVYGGPVTLTNFSVGGMDSAWGLANISNVAAARPDLVLLAFGMNDSGGRPAKDFRNNTRGMIEGIAKTLPDTEFILIATMLGNRDWTTLHHELFLPYRDALFDLCRSGVALADMTSIWDTLLQNKRDWDMTGNGVNHPNDFGHRIYAQVLSALLIKNFPMQGKR
jgi:lysophospholipase L1-like esterase